MTNSEIVPAQAEEETVPSIGPIYLHAVTNRDKTLIDTCLAQFGALPLLGEIWRYGIYMVAYTNTVGDPQPLTDTLEVLNTRNWVKKVGLPIKVSKEADLWAKAFVGALRDAVSYDAEEFGAYDDCDVSTRSFWDYTFAVLNPQASGLRTENCVVPIDPREGVQDTPTLAYASSELVYGAAVGILVATSMLCAASDTPMLEANDAVVDSMAIPADQLG